MTQDSLSEEVLAIQNEIMAKARKQYSAQVIQHWMQPHHAFPMEDSDGHASITGPCGDTMQFWIKVQDDRLQQVSFITDGCASSIASGSMTASLAEKMEIQRIKSIDQQRILDCLGGLPEAEQHCALLAATTLKAALKDYLANRNTESWKKLYR